MQVAQIDHVEMEVPSRYEAARWYRSALEFEVCEEFEVWAKVDGGPLMISTDDCNRFWHFLLGNLKALSIRLGYVDRFPHWRGRIL